MNENKVYLEKVRDDFKGMTAGQRIWLTKHSWDCGWYWGFGYIGNANLHTHFDSEFLHTDCYTPDKIFSKTKITEQDWWIIRDLMVQAYALKDAAGVYKHGGHQTTKKGVTDIIKNEELAKSINQDLEKILNKVWDILTNICKGEIK